VPGSIIGCESQTLGETLDVAGTPFSLNYNSDRVPLSSNWRKLTIGIRERPDRFYTIAATVSVAIAGKSVFFESFRAGPATTRSFAWDGLDAFGRPVVGSATATVETHWYGEEEVRRWTDSFGKPVTGFDGAPFQIIYVPFSYQHRYVTEVPGYSPLAGRGSCKAQREP
jgi:hypothetical protein